MAPILEDASGLAAGVDFHLGYSPERIDPGNPKWRLENTPKVVSGGAGPAHPAPRARLQAQHGRHARVPVGVEPVDCVTAEVRAADAVVVLVDHDRFDFDLVGRSGRYVLDTRNCLDGPTVERI